MSDGNSSEKVPDFIPGWFDTRLSNPDPATREAVRIPEAGDHFPVTFLRSSEVVRNSTRPQRGFTIGLSSQPGHDRFDLAVPPGYWIVRDSDGHLHNWRDEDFKAKYSRSDRKWTPPVDRLRDNNPHLSEEQRAEIEDQLHYADDGWKGTPPAEGTRRKLICDAVERLYGRTGEYAASDRPQLALMVADEVESALLYSVIDDDGREADAQEAISAVGEALDRIDAPQGATFAEWIDWLHREVTRGPVGHVGHEGVPGPRDDDRPATLRIVLDDVSQGEGPPEYVFVELENQHGAGVRGFPMRPTADGKLLEVEIPYGRTDRWVQQVVMRAIIAGQEVDTPWPADVVDEVCREFGVRPRLPRNWPPIHGRRENRSDV